MTESISIPPPASIEPIGLRVLIADDNPENREGLELAVRLLGHTCVVAKDGLEAWELNQIERADVILADWDMPRMDGPDLCRQIRLDPASSSTQFILVTGKSDKSDFIEGMHAGADAYITKPVDIDELEVRLGVAYRAVSLERQRELQSSALRRKSDRDFRAARTDPLTLVSNRLELTEDLELIVSRARRCGRPYSAAICDIDSFKAYNDSFGHLAGDDVLRRVAHALQAGLRRGDGFYRYGGEEFLAILPDQTLAEARVGMDRVRRDVEELRIAHSPRASTRFVTVSVGIAELHPDSVGIDDWLRRADTALYAAKASGSNRVVLDGEVEVRSRVRSRAPADT